jgi:WD40 repeat protein
LHFAGAITRLDVSRNGRTLWTQGPGSLLPQQWDLNTLEVLQYCPLRTSEIGPNQRGIPSPEGDKLAFYEGDLSTINLWTPGTWKADQLANQRLGQVRSLVFSPTDDALFTGTATPTRLIRSESSILGKKVSFDTRLLRDAAASLREWNPEDGSERPQLGGPDVMAPPDLVAMSSDGRTLAVGGQDGCVYLWDRDSRSYRQRLFVGPYAANYIPGIEIARQNPFGVNPQYPESVRAVAFCYCKDLLVTFSTRGVVTLWDSSQYRQIRQFTVDLRETRWVGFSPGGDLVLSQSGPLKFQDPISGELRCTLGGEGEEPIVCVAFSRDGALVAIADQKNRIHLWDRQSGTDKGQLLGHMDQVNALAFTPDSRTLASASNDRTVKLWSVATLTEMASLEAHAGNVTCLAFNSAGTILATGGDVGMGQGEVFLWRAPPGR